MLILIAFSSILFKAIYYKLFVLLNHSVPIHEEYYYKKGVEYAEHGCNVMRWRL